MSNMMYRGKISHVDIKIRELSDLGVTEMSKLTKLPIITVKVRLKIAIFLAWDYNMSRTYTGVLWSGQFDKSKLAELFDIINNSFLLKSSDSDICHISNDDSVAISIHGMPIKFISGAIIESNPDTSIEELYDASDLGTKNERPNFIYTEKGIKQVQWLD